MSTRAAEQFTTIRTEGGLLPPGLLARVAAGDATLPGLTPDAYHLTPGERFGEVINRSWLRLVGAWAGFRDALTATKPGDPATGLTRDRWLLILFAELGYGRLPPARAVELDGVSFPVSHGWGPAPIHLVGAGLELDIQHCAATNPGNRRRVKGGDGVVDHGRESGMKLQQSSHRGGIVFLKRLSCELQRVSGILGN